MKYVLKVAYDGTAFNGFQRQSQDKTVQGVLEGLLSQFFAREIQLVAAGRTDSGVHGRGQVVAFECEAEKELGRLCHALNAMARDPLAVLEAVRLAPDDPFHPRYSARARTYHYFLLDSCGPEHLVFWQKRTWCLSQTLDLDQMRQTCAELVGVHDFTTFSYKSAEQPTRVRSVAHFGVVEESVPSLLSSTPGPRLLRIEIRANGFLRRMVRLLTASLVEVGLGARKPEEVVERLKACNAELAPHPAPPYGLTLHKVHYQPDPFQSESGHRVEASTHFRVKNTRID